MGTTRRRRMEAEDGSGKASTKAEAERKSRWMTVAISLCCIFGGCCVNVVLLELIVKSDPSCGSLVTFAQFLFISVEGLAGRLQWSRHSALGVELRTPGIPLYCYFVMVSMFWVSSIMNNWVFHYHISLPLHSVFRSSSMVMNVLTAFAIYQRIPSLPKSLTIVLMTVAVCMLAIVSVPESKNATSTDDENDAFRLEWITGVGILFFAQFLSSLLGIYQERTYRTYGKAHAKESMFFTHFLSLPLFLLSANEIIETVWRWNALTSDGLVIGGVVLPKMWVYLFFNMFSQWICIRGVYMLISNTNSLALTVALSVRKFVSLIFSILYFRNPFTFYHWVGSFVVIGGALVFSYYEATEKSPPPPASSKVAKE
eukprot:TRINITY_DN8585_c0_g1_i1.p1 TRINITY_DN8585_c0_g1~~TRINITY_DN8585_c0_g1_i1.p1  ORF type:complete len:370 (+),score=92.46 TRINITY_DN8585_c0_g1_i1:176-1285(+)